MLNWVTKENQSFQLSCKHIQWHVASRSSCHGSLVWTNLARELDMVWLNHSSKPFACGWLREVKGWLMTETSASYSFCCWTRFPGQSSGDRRQTNNKQQLDNWSKTHHTVWTINLFQWISHMWSRCTSKFGEIIWDHEDVLISRRWSWAYWPNEIHPYVKPRGFHWN